MGRQVVLFDEKLGRIYSHALIKGQRYGNELAALHQSEDLYDKLQALWILSTYDPRCTDQRVDHELWVGEFPLRLGQQYGMLQIRPRGDGAIAVTLSLQNHGGQDGQMLFVVQSEPGHSSRLLSDPRTESILRDTLNIGEFKATVEVDE